MRKSILSTLAIAALLVSFTSCKENTKATEATPTAQTPTEEAILVDEEEVIVEEVEIEDTEAAAEADLVEATPNTVSSEKVSEPSSSDKSELKHDGSYGDVKDDETVVVTYSYTVMGKAITGSKTFKGHQKEVEAGVHKLTDSLKKIDPNIKITTN
ncbi:hypothetical protein KO493_08625 [Tamlana agarivorans]|uniref:Uncharacterized protein n=1 Tax=Pseudotamlana agarivorans TaxID=481183 RepID=A0ACC5U8W5_9FLAO|nr:hypothetical protein [Tamlana agarivorans]MBU2950759.1 hypothetical protein [Tamlana agarivorans]